VSAYAGGALTAETAELRRTTHRTIQRVTHDLSERYQPNTAIAALMEHMNALHAFKAETPEGRAVLREGLEALLHMLSPFAPHVADELYERIGGAGTLLHAACRSWTRARCTSQRGSAGAGQRQGARACHGAQGCQRGDRARGREGARAHRPGARRQDAQKAIYVPGKIVTLVVG